MALKAERRIPAIDRHFNIVGWSEEDRAFVGCVAEFESLADHGRTLEAALRKIKAVVQVVLEGGAASCEDIPQPFSKRCSGEKLKRRLPERLHRQLALGAARQGISLNQLINLKLTAA